MRYAIEIRHDSFMVPEFFSLLRKHEMAFVLSDAAAIWPYAEDLTADFVYCRLHGAEKLYSSGYEARAIRKWADRIRKWRAGKQPRDAILVTSRKLTHPGPRDIYLYFDNDAKVHAPFDAQRLAKQVGLILMCSNWSVTNLPDSQRSMENAPPPRIIKASAMPTASK